MAHSMKKKIIIVDDHPMMRKGLTNTLELEPGYEVVAQFEKAEDVLENFNNYETDLMIVDISLPGMNGIELVKNIVFQDSQIKILVVSRHDEILYAERALRAGAKGYIMKFESSEELLKAVRKVLNGRIYVSEAISEKLLMEVTGAKHDKGHSPLDLLSDRELEVYELTGMGKSTHEIADQLHLASKTVESYRARIKEKLEFKNTTEMLIHAVKWLEDGKKQL